MPIKYPVGVGTVLLCDYSRGGFQEPEMIKRRPAIVLSQRLPYRDGLCAVVPLSTSPPAHAVPYIVKLELTAPLPEPYEAPVMWAKCDMIATVGFARLDLFRTERDHTGKRKYLHPKLPDADLHRVRAGILHSLGLDGWIAPLPPGWG